MKFLWIGAQNDDFREIFQQIFLVLNHPITNYHFIKDDS